LGLAPFNADLPGRWFWVKLNLAAASKGKLRAVVLALGYASIKVAT
jgi:hypothetical protein